jgi:hypothetical protein
MTHKEYIELFHRAQINLVAFKPVFHCDAELKAMVELAIKEEREACAKDVEAAYTLGLPYDDVATAIRARGGA